MATKIASTSASPRIKHKRAGANIFSILPFVLFLIAYFLAPRFTQEKTLTALIYIGINVILALGLNLLMGYAGQISLGHAAFFGLGAYISAILTVQPIGAEVVPGFSAGLGVIAGIAVLMSLTKVSGWKLATGIAALFILSWICRLAHLGQISSIVIFTTGMAIFAFILRLGWWKSALAGIVATAGGTVCARFLMGVQTNGGTSPWIGMFVGVLITGLIAYLIGAQVLRLKGHYLAMATLGFGFIVEIMFEKWVAVTGGSSDGICGIPSIMFVDGLPRPLRKLFEIASAGHLGPKEQYYYLVWAFAFLALLLAANIVRSRVGRAFRAVHGSEVAAESLGVNTERYKIQVFVLSAALASIAGSLYAHNFGVGYINPNEFNFMVSIQLVVMVVIGGMASVWGALFGATAIQFLKNWILTLDKTNIQFHGHDLALKGLSPIIFGSILVLVMILLPQGLVRGLTDIIGAAIRGARRTTKRSVE